MSLSTGTRHFHMNLGYQGTRGIKHPQTAIFGFLSDRLRNAMSAKNNDLVVRHFVQLFHKYRTGIAQLADDILVVNHFVTHINRRLEYFQGPLDYSNSAINSGTKATWVRQQNLHHFLLRSARLFNQSRLNADNFYFKNHRLSG